MITWIAYSSHHISLVNLLSRSPTRLCHLSNLEHLFLPSSQWWHSLPYWKNRINKKTSTSLYLNLPISLHFCLPSHHCGCLSNRHLSILLSKSDIYSDPWLSSLPIHLRTLGLPMSLLSFHFPTLLDHFHLTSFKNNQPPFILYFHWAIIPFLCSPV